jgi:hypothetical protein
MTFVRTKLGLIDTPHPLAAVLKVTQLPVLRGNEQENLLCGSCEVVLGKSISALTAKTRFATPHQLIIVCPRCAANNVLPSTVADRA